MPLRGAYVLPVHRTHAALPGCVLWVPGGHAVQERPLTVKPGRHAAQAQHTALHPELYSTEGLSAASAA